MNIFIITSLYTTFMSFTEKLFKNKHSKSLFLFLLILPIFIISWRRGNTTVDYGNYEYIFITSKNLPLLTGWKTLNIEPGYFVLNKVVGYFSSNFSVFLFIYSSIILGIYYFFIKSYSNFFSMSILLLIAFGSYYTSFNTMRQFLAATICILAVLNIEKSFWKYFFIIIIASLFHSSALIMIPFYYLLNLKINKLKDFSILFLFLSISFILMLYAPNIVSYLTSSIYSDYNNMSSFGISTGVPLSSIVRIVFLLIYYFAFYKMINFDDKMERIGFNSVIITLVFMLFSTRVEMFQRFTYFFLPYMIIFTPNLTSKIIDKNTRIFFNAIIFIVCLVYIFITQRNILFIWI